MTTATVALIWRMLANGVRPPVVAETTGTSLGEVLDLLAEMPAPVKP